MRTGVFWSVLFFIAVIGILFNGVETVSGAVYNATAGTNTIYECGNIIVAGTYSLNQSVNATGVAGACLNITSSNVILNGTNSLLFGNDNSTSYGVYTRGRVNITIKDFNNITDFNWGIYLEDSNYSAITNLTLISNSKYKAPRELISYSI